MPGRFTRVGGEGPSGAHPPKPRVNLENLFRFTATVFVSFPRTTWAPVGWLRHKLDSPFYFFPVLIGSSRFSKKQAFRMPGPDVPNRISSFLRITKKEGTSEIFAKCNFSRQLTGSQPFPRPALSVLRFYTACGRSAYKLLQNSVRNFRLRSRLVRGTYGSFAPARHAGSFQGSPAKSRSQIWKLAEVVGTIPAQLFINSNSRRNE
jgi:hypothetical protein